MKAKPLKFIEGTGYIPCKISEATHLQLNMPGPFAYRNLPVMIDGTRKGTGNWTWNGDVDKPTLKPSLLTRAKLFTDQGHKDYMAWYKQGCPPLECGVEFESKEMICHTWITDGKVIFLDDCTHELKGQTLDLLNIEDFDFEC